MTSRKRKKKPPNLMSSHLDSLIACFPLVDLPNFVANSRSRFQIVLFPCLFFEFGFSAVAHPSQVVCGCDGLVGVTHGSSDFTVVQAIQASGQGSAIVGCLCQDWRIWPVSCVSACPFFVRPTQVCTTPTPSILLF